MDLCARYSNHGLKSELFPTVHIYNIKIPERSGILIVKGIVHTVSIFLENAAQIAFLFGYVLIFMNHSLI